MPFTVVEGNKAYRRRLLAFLWKAGAWLRAIRTLPARGLATMRYRLTERTARAWLPRLTSGQATTEDAVAFRRWCKKNTQNRLAFARVRRQWMHLRTILGTADAPPGHEFDWRFSDARLHGNADA